MSSRRASSHPWARRPFSRATTVSARARERQREAVGSLGSGNHYLEIQSVEAVLDARAIERELERYSPDLAAKPRWLVLNKLDMVEDPAAVQDRICQELGWTGPVFGISALTGGAVLPNDFYDLSHISPDARAA